MTPNGFLALATRHQELICANLAQGPLLPPQRAHKTEKPMLSTLGAVREPRRVNVRPTRSSRDFYRVKVRWSTRVSTPCALGRPWGAWRELWERCWKPTRLCSIVFEAAQQAQHAAPVAQESQSYPTIGWVTQFVLDWRIWHARSTRRRRIVRNHPKRNSPGDLRLADPQWSHQTCPRASRCHHGGFRKNEKILFCSDGS